MIRTIIYFLGSALLFFVSMILYGIILNVAEIPLEKILTEKSIDLSTNLNLTVHKNEQRLLVYTDTTFIKSYKIVFGRSPSSIKRSADDYVTPIGEYSVCSIPKRSH